VQCIAPIEELTKKDYSKGKANCQIEGDGHVRGGANADSAIDDDL